MMVRNLRHKAKFYVISGNMTRTKCSVISSHVTGSYIIVTAFQARQLRTRIVVTKHNK